MRVFFAVFFLIISAPAFAGDNPTYYAEAEGLLTVELIDKTLTWRDERAALSVLTKICIPNRKKANRAKRLLRKNGYFRGYYTIESDGKTVSWFHPGALPTVSMTHSGRIITDCSIIIAKKVAQFADLEQQLDAATPGDISRYPKSTLHYGIGERGWVLRPGFEHSVVFLESPRGISGIALRYLGD